MKLDKSLLDITDFNIRECIFGGDKCIWVFPKLEGTSWNEKNEILRSSIWRDSDGELVSPGFKKFFNWEQCPNIHPAPDVLHSKIKCVDKIDGSCLIVSRYKGELITRTRRALTSTLLNGDEVDKILKVKYPKVFSNRLLNAETHTFLFEWVTPSNLIVVKHLESELYLTGCIRHSDYTYEHQAVLDGMAIELGVKRPSYHSFPSVAAMLSAINELKGAEGVCVYYGNEQRIRKAKSEWYNINHCFRNEMNLKNIVDLFLEHGMPSYGDFCNMIQNQFDYEGLVLARPLISQICDAKEEADKIVAGMKAFLEKIKNLPSRKEKAAQIINSYGVTNRTDIVFCLLDGKQVNREQWKKLLFQKLITL